MALIMV